MKKIAIVALVLASSISLSACASGGNDVQVKAEEQIKETKEMDEEEVASLVENFGKKLQMVSLLAPEDILKKSMEENYREFVSTELLAKWQEDPQIAPGRMVSSPWPDRINILAIDSVSESEYQVNGEIIEVTSVEKAEDGIAAKRPITLIVRNINDSWRIDEVTLGEYEDIHAINYKNTQYGFAFSLPEGWKGYKIVTDQWEGFALDDQEGEKNVETGPLIYIRHPQWTSENPRQDIPIMVFTNAQWDSLQQGDFHIGAAPIDPSELGRNSKYVFALPARYNYAFPTGYEEVDDIIQGNPLRGIENDHGDK